MNRFQLEPIIKDNLLPVTRLTGPGCFGYYSQNNRGMTLIEVLIVIVIIGVLSSIAIPTYFSTREKAKMAATISEIKILEKMIQGYNIDHNSYPENLDELGRKIPKDPWGNPYQYLKIEGTKNGIGKMRKDRSMVPVNSDFDLYSKGRDGKSQSPFTSKASQDDIVRANNGRFIGLVSDY
jgi:general secretion pathway protein G